ncbi:DNA segregation ATPase FtsK/SpoIIIE, S-DNA-T family [Meinhardsimonia xiamenensis]|jgi:S-DNA-T family DNA segregation ATPase FtsK/SpoIIIE|uniref:DNA translocase FtsK n=1 Tax=Meinhardsimonia xiamenensis TaxID=990712 RepID=A0A1G8YLD5_9RHOB|nr:DNA translocase FtsK [Meinhardsimonia xiamenensis]PRX37349.1 S-DNA-T family DNA segregation ATPase FtsK/SpoIIIE [Meinhardsimonia xiamenensis]SDK03679.1 DNA segregation ATPase FtsK/SpoIIIE, S-DNA-T family [Meinhardsimonia xiamenensis]
MASYQARQREPLFDPHTQAVIERRAAELLGLFLIALGGALAAMLATYSPEDPSWLSVGDGPTQNALGLLGASIAAPLMIVVGHGAWALAATAIAWGLRCVLHIGAERALGRTVFTPIAVAVVSVFAASLTPPPSWSHSFGLGGLFGDTVLGAILGLMPVDLDFGVRMAALVAAGAAVAVNAFVIGMTPGELRRLLAFMARGTVLAYAGIVAFLAAALGATGRLAAAALERRARARDSAADRPMPEPTTATAHATAAAAAGPRVAASSREATEAPRTSRTARAEPPLAARRGQEPDPMRSAPQPAPAQSAADAETQLRGPLKLRLPGLMKRAGTVPETPEPPAAAPGEPELSGEERIRAKIADVIRSRVRQRQAMTIEPRSEPPVSRTSTPLVRKGDDEVAGFAVVEDEQDLEQLDTLAAAARPASCAAQGTVQGAAHGPAEPGARRDAVNAAAPPRAAPAPQTRPVVQHTPRKAPAPSRRAMAEAQPGLPLEETPPPAYEPPPLSLLTDPAEIPRHHLSDEALEENARMLENVLEDYGVKGEIVTVRPGPVVTMYELEPAPGLKASRVIGLADDIARSMSALSARVSTVPGRSVIGIELPNVNREKVVLREILASRDFGDSHMRLPLALGKDIGGDPVVANLAKMPHLLIAGTTGSGKSVAINTMILSLLYKLSPEECRLIMIDPKMLELSVYDGIPHLLSPVVTDPKKAVVALKWVVGEMEDRYRKMSKMGVRNIEGYNARVRDALARGEMFSRTVQTGFDEETGEPVFETEEFAPETLPYIVVIVDEMADLMMVAGKEIEACIQRLAQMARASGIHLIMATQRPSVDVITGTIKANFPTRISFQVTSKVDSRTILGEQGAEQLLGQGDMLYMAGGARIMRVHGPFVSDEEVEEVVNYLKSYGPPEYVGGVVEGPDEEKESDIDLVLGLGGNTNSDDALYDQAVQIVIRDRKCSTSYIQRKLAIGYNKAARLVEQMEEQGVVSPANHVGKREVLVPEPQ